MRPLRERDPRAASAQAGWNPALSQRVRLISLSFDPAHDTPAVMRAYGVRVAREGAAWQFLTTASEAALQRILDGYRQTRQGAYDTTGKLTTYLHLLRMFLIDERRVVRNIYSADFLHPTLLLHDNHHPRPRVDSEKASGGGAAKRTG